MPCPGKDHLTEHDEDETAGGLGVQLAAELIERAKAEGVSLVGPDGLLAGDRNPRKRAGGFAVHVLLRYPFTGVPRILRPRTLRPTRRGQEAV